MKSQIVRAIVCISLVFAMFSASTAYADFFSETVYPFSPETERLVLTRLSDVDLIRPENRQKYRDTRNFLAALAREIARRYESERIRYYRMYDLIIDYESLVYELDSYFIILAETERRDDALLEYERVQRLVAVRAAYEKLQGHLEDSIVSR